MEILCPQCGFGREVAGDKIPAKSVFATCPKCRFKFRFRAPQAEPDFELGDDEAPAAPVQAPPAAPRLAAPARDAEGPEAGAARPEDRDAASRPAPPTPLQSLPADDRPVRRIVLREDAPDDAPRDPDAAPNPETGRNGRPSDIWQKLENLASEENRRAEREEGTYAFQDAGPGREAGNGPPWEHLDRHGFFHGLWATIKGAVFRPTQFFRAMPVTGGMAKPLGFYILLSMLSATVQTFWNALLFDTLNQYFQFPPEIASHIEFNLGRDLLTVGVLTPAFSILYIFIFSGIMHLALRTLRSGEGGFEGTLRAMAYTNAVAVFSLVPFLGPLVGVLWWMVIYLIALKEAHRASYGRVLLAMHLPLVVVILAAVVAFTLPGAG